MDDLRKLHEERDDWQIMDVREDYEWDAGHIDGAIHVPLAQVMAGAQPGLDRDRPVAVICRTGNRSELASVMLQARGYRAVNVDGGMEAWAAAGLPFAASDGRPGQVA